MSRIVRLDAECVVADDVDAAAPTVWSASDTVLSVIVSSIKVADPPLYSPMPPPNVRAVLPDTAEFVRVKLAAALLTQMPPQSLPSPWVALRSRW